jgi:eukaryotic-like serine/threonine-protein kinase
MYNVYSPYRRDMMKRIFSVMFLLLTACGPSQDELAMQTSVAETAIAASWTTTPYPSEITDAKGVIMRLVPEGEFTMGSNDGNDDAKPVHTVYLDAYYIDNHEVTNALYKACADADACSPLINAPYKACADPGACSPAEQTKPSYYGNPEFDNYPVIYVNWDKAQTFCAWRDARLPTEAEWEKAARGTDARIHPWGNTISCTFANYGHCVGDTTPVGSYENGQSPYGVYDMTGNVWEWIADWYSATYYQSSPLENPLGPESGEGHVLRGGAWDNDFGLRSAARYSSPVESGFLDVIGFRCAKDATQ